MNLLDIKKGKATLQPNHSILIYGPPKGGKTRLIATAAKLKEVAKIYWFDIENGIETLLNMDLTDEELAKIVVIKIADTRDNPIAIETLLKCMTSKVPVKICETHGKVDCAECAKAARGFINFSLKECRHNELIVIDSGSQLGDSALAAACLGKPNMYKPTFDEYGQVNKWLGDVMSVVQQCTNTNFVVATHELCMEDDEDKEKFVPLMGSRAFSLKCAKYFGTVVYVHKKLNKHTVGSSSTYLGDRLTGSRLGVAMETAEDKSMKAILVDSGVLREGEVVPSEPTLSIEAPAPVDSVIINTSTPVAGKLSLAERLKLKQQQGA